MVYTENQKTAINTIDKNLQIIACAGSGKTQVISERIVNILKSKSDIHPKNIIAFTYTEKASAELKLRVLRLCQDQLGNVEGIGDMYIGTIHGWCLRTLQDNILEYQKFSILDEIKLKLFIDRHFNSIGMTDLNMRIYQDTGYFLQMMTIIRESELTAPLSADIQTALEKYESCLIEKCYFDYTMIQTKLLEHLNQSDDFEKSLKERLKYLVVDEYQDVNPIQEKIIQRLFSLNPNICVVGDDDQTIYEWRGSEISNIINFRERYSLPDNPVEYIKLEDNFRSSKAVVESAETIIRNNPTRLDKLMNASGHQQYDRGDTLYEQFDNTADETAFIIRTIQNLRGKAFKDKNESEERGLDYSDFAILIRRWANAEEISNALRDANIPYVVAGVNQLFRQPEIQAARDIFLFLDGQLDGDTLVDLWQEVCDDRLDDTKLRDAIEILEKNKPTKEYYESFILQDIYIKFLDNAGITESIFPDTPESPVAGDTQGEIVFFNLGMFSHVINDFESIHFVSRPANKLRNFINFMRYAASDYYPEGWLSDTFKTPNAVQIMTVYQAKGLEFPVVFIPWLNRNNFPIKRASGTQVWHFLNRNLIRDQHKYERNIEAERRLLYVAITRAKKYVFMSRGSSGRLYGRESEFGQEIRNNDYVFSSPHRDYSERQVLPPTPSDEAGTLNLNFSVLKLFFECNYSFKFYCLYGFHPKLGARIGYGRSIHHALMEIHRRALQGDVISDTEIPSLIDKHSHYPYAFGEAVDKMKHRANKNIDKYLNDNKKDFPNIEYAEKNIEIDLGGGIMVQGRMDLIKKKNLDGTYETTIVEYKSTEDAQAYNVTIGQLELYSLGYEALTGQKADFLEIFNVDENSRHRKELTKKAMDDMKQTVIQAAQKIRDNDLADCCGKPDCACRFK
ncbi:ATP-dependent helicase [candidate division KSB1 bacterium]